MSSPKPNLEIFIRYLGKYKDDLCLVCEVGNQIVGAVRTRLINDYGHINDETPSLAISALKKYRNSGIGKRLMKQMLIKLKSDGYRQVSLSVEKTIMLFICIRNWILKFLLKIKKIILWSADCNN